MLNACLSHSWLDKSFRPRSQVAQFRPRTRAVKVRTLVGSKDMRRANGVSPRVGSSPELPSRLVVSLRVRHWSYP